MNLIDRAKNILLTPRTEWLVIRSEFTTVKDLYFQYVLPLSLIPAVASLITGLLWSFTSGLVGAVTALISVAVSFFVGSYITDALAPTFSSEKDLNRSAQLVGYSYTASAVAGIFGIIPIIGVLVVLAGAIYSAYLMYLGTAPMKNTPSEKRVAYVIVIILVQMVLYFALASLLAMIMLPRIAFDYK